MDSQSKHVDKMLEVLYTWFPYGPAFRSELINLLTLQEVRSKQTLYRSGSHVLSAWFSIDCWAAQYENFPSGTTEVVALFKPGEIFTDLYSFFLGKEAATKMVILEGTSLFQLTKKSFQKLKIYPETYELLQHLMLLTADHTSWRIELLALCDKDKIRLFAEKYPLHIFPAHVAASYLRIDPSRFSILRGNYNKSR